jgi:alkanesulfonate monooxygenase SsuD/methylene tetrahydromethanopterin reductase-like flavin-dependent oxidoreductase (luciferase family)
VAWAGDRFLGARGDMLEEGIAAFQNLATEKVSTFDGKYYSFRALELAPKPLQRPFPLFIGRA